MAEGGIFMEKYFEALPQCFKDKIEIDRTIETVITSPVISYDFYKKLKHIQTNIRFKCQQLIKMNRDERGGRTG